MGTIAKVKTGGSNWLALFCLCGVVSLLICAKSQKPVRQGDEKRIHVFNCFGQHGLKNSQIILSEYVETYFKITALTYTCNVHRPFQMKY